MTPDPFDQSCRYAARLDPIGFLCWVLGLRATAFSFRRWLDTRMLPFPGKPERTSDTVAHLDDVADNYRPWLAAIEFQGQPDSLMFGRMLVYLGTLWQEHKPSDEAGDRFCLMGVVVNLTGEGHTSQAMRWVQADVNLELKVKERNLATEDAGELLDRIEAGTVARVMLCFIPLLHGGGELAIIQRWLTLASAEPDAWLRSEYGGLALVLAEKAKCVDVWEQALKGWNMVQSKVVAGWQAQAALRTRVEDLLDVLEARFGPLPADLVTALQGVTDAATLKQWLKVAAKAASLDFFRQQARV